MSSDPKDGLPLKRSVALVIRDPHDRERVLLVQRPPDDEDLPLAWGLPAGSLRPGESWEDAVERAAREKLGLRVCAGALLNEGADARREYRLEMRVYAAWLDATAPAGTAAPGAEPRLDDPSNQGTRYLDWTWDVAQALLPAAARGSLCSRLFLETR